MLRYPRKVQSRALGRIALAALALTVVLAACGSTGSSSSVGATTPDAKTDSAASPAIPATIPAGTSLRVADQLQLLETILSTGGQNRAFPYAVHYSNFVGGPPMLQAFHANAVDIGYVADTPLILAQAADQAVVAVAAIAAQHGTDELIAAPGSGITGWGDLKGKKVAYQEGTVLEAVVLQGLHETGLSLSDIRPVNLPVTQIAAALQGGSVQAAILAPPLDSAYLSSHPGAKVIDRPSDITDRVSFIIASKQALSDPGKEAAIRDYLVRLVRSYHFIALNPDVFVKNFYVDQYHLTQSAGLALLKQTGSSTPIPSPGSLVPAQQALADLYTASGEIPQKIDVSAEFDARFDAAVANAAKS